jgi:predicted nucleic acid-binding protein
MEALGFNFETATEQNTMEAFIDNVTMLDMENMIVIKTIEIRKNIKIALPDAIIAATALVYDLTLLSRNTKDFIDVPNLKLKNPWEA